MCMDVVNCRQRRLGMLDMSLMIAYSGTYKHTDVVYWTHLTLQHLLAK